jgi:SAM-dependent methyltransferase
MTQKIRFIENDINGETILDVISKANKFNKWMYTTIKPHLNGKVLEIGSGIGNISNYVIKDGFKIMMTDLRAGYCDGLEKKFGKNTNILGIEIIDLVDPKFDEKYSKYFGQYDTLFALNVLEHIHDDELALKNCYKLLVNGGILVILVPSYQSLFNQFDLTLGHCRRYNKKSLSNVFTNSGYNIMHKQYFNFIGIFGWYFNGKIFKRKIIPAGQMRLYNTFVPIFKVIDKIILNSIGLSVIIVGGKQSIR